MTDQPVVGMVGLGNMGSALAENLVGAGLTLVAHDAAGSQRCPSGAEFVDDLAELARVVDVVVLSLPNGAACTEVCGAMLDAPHRTVTQVVDTSTIGPDTARRLATALGAAAIGYVDAPVSGGVAGARARTLAVMFAGAPESCSEVAAVLAGLSDRRFHIGDQPGMAQAVKLANNFLSATALAATSEAVAFATAEGVEMGTLLEVLNASSGQSAALTDKFVHHVLTGTFSSGFTNTLMAKDVALYLDATVGQGTPALVGRLTNEIWQRFAADQPDCDFTRIYPFTAGD
jgi:3-hydroxyisobutyrate dehydrogenase